MLIPDSIAEFLAYKRDGKQLVTLTLRSYKYVLGEFAAFASGLTIEQITPDLLRRYCQWLGAAKSGEDAEPRNPLEPSTARGHWTVVKGYVYWLHRTGRIATNPIPYVELPNLNPPKRNLITASEVRQIMDIVERVDSLPQRALNRAIIQVMASTGVRGGEACAIAISDLHFEENRLTIQRGKGNKRRDVPLTDACKAALREWITVRAVHFPEASGDTLFIHSAGRDHFKPEGLRRRLCDLAKLAGIPDFKRFTCHAWRRFAAVEFYKKTRDIRAVQMLLGHSNVQTTERYINLDAEHLIEMRESLSLSDAPPIPLSAGTVKPARRATRTTMGRLRLSDAEPPSAPEETPPALVITPTPPISLFPALLTETSPEMQALAAQMMQPLMQQLLTALLAQAAQGTLPTPPLIAPEAPPAIPEPRSRRRTSLRRRP